jgi:hypothetical protein
MKNIFKITVILSIFISLISCQDVVDVDLETAQERLVIEALIGWENGTTGNNQQIRLSKTASFYTNEIAYATGANVKVINTNTLTEFIFTETTNGSYETNSFIPVLGDIYRLEINYNGQNYTSEEKLLATPAIANIVQTTANGFSTTDPEVNIYFQDDINQDNYYRTIFTQYRPSISEIIDTDDYNLSDEFENGNLMSDFYESEDILVNDEFEIVLYSITEGFYNFIALLNVQADSGIGPFSSPPVNVKGNCINTANNEANYPYGYFALFEVQKENYTFQ